MTRAVYLDAVPDQSTETFLRCLKRFSARRGLPAKFISDNGKTFKAATKYLKAVIKDGKVKEYLAGLGTDWHGCLTLSVLHGGEAHFNVL